ncbi:MAG: hypothetical protein WD904_01480 [Dehalococcoidia bacterium]
MRLSRKLLPFVATMALFSAAQAYASEDAPSTTPNPASLGGSTIEFHFLENGQPANVSLGFWEGGTVYADGVACFIGWFYDSGLYETISISIELRTELGTIKRAISWNGGDAVVNVELGGDAEPTPAALPQAGGYPANPPSRSLAAYASAAAGLTLALALALCGKRARKTD